MLFLFFDMILQIVTVIIHSTKKFLYKIIIIDVVNR